MEMSEKLDARGRARVQTVNNEPSKTQQGDHDLADIRSILKRFDQVGIVDHLESVDAAFVDVSELPEDYSAVMRYSRQAEQQFMKLPSKLRALFNHDAAEWLDAAHDQDHWLRKNHDKLVKAGLAEPAPEPSPPPVTPPDSNPES
jgi:hypothetical protein